MRFYWALLRVASRSPRLAAEALYWQITGKKKRARNRLRLSYAQTPSAYRAWIRSRERAAAPDAREAAQWAYRPRLSVLVYHAPGEDIADYERRLSALEKQSYGEWELVLAHSREASVQHPPVAPRVVKVPVRTDNPARALGLCMAAASGDYVLPLGGDVLLSPHALMHIVKALQGDAQPSVLYGDEDRIARTGRRSAPWFKPEWNAELFLAQDYLSSSCVIRREAALATLSPDVAPAGLASVYALLLALLGHEGAQAVHVPQILAHRTAPLEDVEEILSRRIATVAAHVAPSGALASEGVFGSVSVAWPLPAKQPLVSIIIPTRDHVNLLRMAVAGILTGTRYRHVEVLIIDNGSVRPETAAYLRRTTGNPRVRVIHHDAPFNYSQLNNIAARDAKGDYLLLLNNDVEIIDGNWLTWLVRQAVRPGIGAVGAKLLYDDGTIQHAGVTIGIGDAAGHAHRFQKNSEPGYFARAHLPHYVSAVTGACLLVEKAKFEAVGGLDEQGFAVAFNDVDLCLKLQAAGWRNLYEPRAELIHHESKSRDKDFQPGQIERYTRELALLQDRWGTDGYADPLHHPHLDRNSETYRLYL